MDQDLHKAINWLDAIQIVTILTDVGIHIDDEETIGELREAVRANVEDGTISQERVKQWS